VHLPYYPIAYAWMQLVVAIREIWNINVSRPNTKKLIFHQGPFKDGTNNVGEFLALVHALALLHKNNNTHTAIYTDSKTAMSWVKNKKAKTTLGLTKKNAVIHDLISRAESWLSGNSYQNKIIKWETEVWGEIPADFGRK
jgi:ribonuclease HI